MKIKKVKWLDHPILGNLEIDFTNAITGESFESILFAGENGTGKTTILETLSVFLNIGTFEYFEYIEYLVNGKVYRAIPPPTPTIFKERFQIVDDLDNITLIESNRSYNSELIETNILDIRHYGCIFSKARADYKTERIAGTTTKQLDTDKYEIDQDDNFTSLKQLIVDIHNQDNSEYAEINRGLGSVPKTWEDFYLTSKIFRFKNAFDNFFEKLEYYKVADENFEKSIIFKKNSKSISIDNLSTGEKQIVFRGIYLLKNNKKLDGAAIMIDEPELSMHPKWQKNILKYYKDLFTENGIQKSQLLFATHSEHVLKEALSNKDKNLVIVLNEVGGTIQAKRIDAPFVLPSITHAETNYLAFDIVSNDLHIELYGWLQQKEMKNTIKSCDDYIKGHTFYNSSIHSKISYNPHGTTYDTLSTYIRNAIDHPSTSLVFTEEELRISIELLLQLCR